MKITIKKYPLNEPKENIKNFCDIYFKRKKRKLSSEIEDNEIKLYFIEEMD